MLILEIMRKSYTIFNLCLTLRLSATLWIWVGCSGCLGKICIKEVLANNTICLVVQICNQLLTHKITSPLKSLWAPVTLINHFIYSLHSSDKCTKILWLISNSNKTSSILIIWCLDLFKEWVMLCRWVKWNVPNAIWLLIPMNTRVILLSHILTYKLKTCTVLFQGLIVNLIFRAWMVLVLEVKVNNWADKKLLWAYVSPARVMLIYRYIKKDSLKTSSSSKTII